MGVCAPLPGKPYSSVERRKPFTGKSARSQCEFAPPSRESLITPLRGANRLPGKGAAAVGVCASFPGKPYFSVEKRKPFTRKSAGGRGSLRPIPGKALFLRRGAQTLHPEKPPAAVGVCAPLPGKPYSSVERRKPFTREEPPPAAGVCASLPGKPYSSVERRKPFTRKSPPPPAGVCASLPGKPYSSVERRKSFAGKRRRRLREFAPHYRESLILPLRGANPAPGKGAGGSCVSLRPIPGKGLFFR